MDGNTTDVVWQDLDLTGVNPDPQANAKGAHPFAYCQSGAKCASGTAECREKAISGRVDLAPSEPIDLRAGDAVVIGEELSPGCVAQSLGGASGVHDVGHEESRHHALVLAGDADRSTTPEHVND